MEDHGFTQHKSAFRDAVALRYGWVPSQMPSHCVCGQSFTVQHALSCPRGGFPSIRYNVLQDLTASLLKETCHGVAAEPSLQPITSESFRAASVNKQDGAQLDIVANGFWEGAYERAFFDVRVFNPFARSNHLTYLASTYWHHESLKKGYYEQCVHEVEHSSFTPLVFSLTCGLGSADIAFYKCLASQLAIWKMEAILHLNNRMAKVHDLIFSPKILNYVYSRRKTISHLQQPTCCFHWSDHCWLQTITWLTQDCRQRDKHSWQRRVKTNPSVSCTHSCIYIYIFIYLSILCILF